MKILFLGGDKRYKLMMESLKKDYEVYQIGFNLSDTNIHKENLDNLDLSKFDVILFPISGINDNLEIKVETGLLKIPEHTFSTISNTSKFFTGVKTKKLLELIPNANLISFLDNKEVEKVNNSLTIDRCYS